MQHSLSDNNSHLNKNKTGVVVRVPGSTFLMGEHAVLHGSCGIVCAINRHIIVKGQLRNDHEINIVSALGNFHCHRKNIQQVCSDVPSEHRFIAAVLDHFGDQLSSGFDLHIHSEFSHTVGLGSSSSVTLALIATLSFLFDWHFDRRMIFNHGLSIIKQVQGAGSGADLAASLFGGIIQYTPTPFSVNMLCNTLPLQLYYCGYKTPTAQVIAKVAKASARHPERFEPIYQRMTDCTNKGCDALSQNNWSAFGQLMTDYQALMVELGVSDSNLNAMIKAARHNPHVIGAKISGSGLGDCIIVLNNKTDNVIATLENSLIPVAITSEGLTVEPIAC